ncbi:Glycosyltransferase, catalytic subunit of cellulose synthase and poly-beta-1,6-N-acetylglucosamine synthase [Aquiflexum balticum DSM 16537]|uniref:Glycosyltransferase, catalytic subunit of cellulose synthase and poly-beta-1,6-N-acetylglucosamine synthase n=1 Tax=Aquiflexum balticum DSM 16537 TaxID=758820 RepID=A0A1W2HBZ5_9BACT|nr:glycosyltransferase [Aquiflexum balticum]SMD46405.1 Glycosyltransferase, catalytic subunit of cellulose synthase and poly-beta-1,6-N-acetylglucosamine synthase [Aquiflexum balticum DSM 16537]
MILALILTITVLLIIQDTALWILLKTNFKHFGKSGILEYPRVSILIPSRNEEKNLPECLASLSKLNYPLDKLQVILGDDRSIDSTRAILEAYVDQHPETLLLDIKECDTRKMNGKANALSQMAKKATGEVLLFTDADCIVPENYVTAMVAAWQRTGAGIITGITHVSGDGFFDKMQAMDWWLTLGMVKVISDVGFSVTSMGNNMLISKNAYQSVGGFEGIPFSLTEDFEIAKHILAKGFTSFHLVGKENLISTKPQKKISDLLKQRKRWMAGAMDLPIFWKLLLGLQVLFFPGIVFLLFSYPLMGVLLWICKVAIQSLFITAFASKTAVKINPIDLILFEIYYMFAAWSTIVYYFWPAQTDWKGRRY